MGYTHYWRCTKARQGNAKTAETTYQKAIRQCQRVARSYNAELKAENPKHPARLSGYTVHCKVGTYGGLNINGAKELAHEDFCFREHWNENADFEFCKTARKPYDTVVTACLIIMKHYMGDLIEISSDGDVSEWDDGLELAKRVTKIKNLSVPIQDEEAA